MKPGYFEVEQGYQINLVGKDALQILNNLSTNDLSQLPEGKCAESFITNVKGWVVAHCVVRKSGENLTLWGTHPNPTAIGEHVDRYVIREDVQIEIADVRVFGLSCGGEDLAAIADGVESVHFPAFGAPAFAPLMASESESILEKLRARGWSELDDIARETKRITAGWPRQEKDFGEKTIPQELDRTQEAISFTKGCYLGQETIARLDALGKLQKKLCILSIAGAVACSDAIQASGVEVGQVTSVANQGENTVALAVLKRSGFEADGPLSCQGFAVELQDKTVF